MVAAFVFAGALDCQQITGIGHHAQQPGLALRLEADLTEGFGGEVEAALALADLAAGGEQGIGEGADLFFRLAQQMQG